MTPSEKEAFFALTAANKWIEEAKPLLAKGGAMERELVAARKQNEQLRIQLADARADIKRLDFLERMRVDCEGRVISHCFLPGEKTLRNRIDEAIVPA